MRRGSVAASVLSRWERGTSTLPDEPPTRPARLSRLGTSGHALRGRGPIRMPKARGIAARRGRGLVGGVAGRARRGGGVRPGPGPATPCAPTGPVPVEEATPNPGRGHGGAGGPPGRRRKRRARRGEPRQGARPTGRPTQAPASAARAGQAHGYGARAPRHAGQTLWDRDRARPCQGQLPREQVTNLSGIEGGGVLSAMPTSIQPGSDSPGRGGPTDR